MFKVWFYTTILSLSLLLTACSTQKQTDPQPTYKGSGIDFGGVEPRYEPINPATNNDYSIKGKTYHIVKNPTHFSQTGLATWYGDEFSGNPTAIGEYFDPNRLTAAHATLPLPSYVRVTNLTNGRQIVVRVNDRGPFKPRRIIDLSHASAKRLGISDPTTVRIDYIRVAPDGTFSVPGSIGMSKVK